MSTSTSSTLAQSFDTLPDLLTGNALMVFLDSLQPAIRAMSDNLYRRASWAISASLDDLMQEGMIEAWRSIQDYDASKVTHEDAFRNYCLKRARRAIRRMVYVSQRNAISLEVYQESAPELAEVPAVCASSPDLQQRIQTALQEAGLSPRERLVLQAVFGLGDENGDFQTLDELQVHYGCTRDALRYVKLNGLKKLARILDPKEEETPKISPSGRPKGTSLKRYKEEILAYFQQGATRSWIAKYYGIDHSTFSRWMKRNGILPIKKVKQA